MAEEKKDFVVKDRRIFSEDGTQTESTPESEAEETAEPTDTTETAQAGDADSDQTSAEATSDENFQLPEINFPTFIFSLNSSALVHFGVIEDPATQQKVKNLPMAKQTIDILGMLEEKTKGNLLDDEANMLKTMLYELRMLYVKESQ
jgi:hypothetical protein